VKRKEKEKEKKEKKEKGKKESVMTSRGNQGGEEDSQRLVKDSQRRVRGYSEERDTQAAVLRPAHHWMAASPL